MRSVEKPADSLRRFGGWKSARAGSDSCRIVAWVSLPPGAEWRVGSLEFSSVQVSPYVNRPPWNRCKILPDGSGPTIPDNTGLKVRGISYKLTRCQGETNLKGCELPPARPNSISIGPHP